MRFDYSEREVDPLPGEFGVQLIHEPIVLVRFIESLGASHESLGATHVWSHYGPPTYRNSSHWNGIDTERLLQENTEKFAHKWGLPDAGQRVILRHWVEGEHCPQMTQRNADEGTRDQETSGRSLPQRSAFRFSQGRVKKQRQSRSDMVSTNCRTSGVFSASEVSDKTIGLAMCYQLANHLARCY